MPVNKSKIVVRKTTFDEEQKAKDQAFLDLTPLERLKIHEQLRKRIWKDKYNKTSLKGMKVLKKKRDEHRSAEKYLTDQLDILTLRRILKSKQ